MDKQLGFIPIDKDDPIAIDNLNKAEWNEIEPYTNELLEWIKDMNWPVAKEIARKLSFHTNSIKNNIIIILKGNDGLWKYWCIKQLVCLSQENSIDIEILNELERIIKEPSAEDKQEEVDEIAKEALDKWDTDKR